VADFARELIDLHRRQVQGLVEIRGVRRMRALYNEARTDLEEKLRALMRAGRGTTFSAHHVRQILIQVEDAIRQIEAGARAHLEDLDAVAKELAPRHIVRTVNALSVHYGGGQPVVQAQQAAVFTGVYRDTVPSLLDRHAASVRTYGRPVIEKVRKQMALSILQGEDVDAAVGRVAGAAGIVAQDRWRAERIVRTEAAYSYGVAAQAGMQALGRQVPRMMKRLVATFDPRTGDDSRMLHGQTVPVDQPFVWHVHDHRGRPTGKTIFYMQPPNRPNDREITIPWLASWDGAATAIGEPGAVQPSTRGLPPGQ
jgi:hypothetical protein